MRPLTICLVTICLLALTACGPSEKVRAGQNEADAAIAAAGLHDEVTADFSCTGPLPGAETYCDLTITVTTDDLATVEKAAEIVFSQPAESLVYYRGISYDGGLGSIDEIRAFDPYITDDMEGATVAFSSASAVRLNLVTMPSFADICDLAEDISEGYPAVSVTSGRDDDTAAYWGVEELDAGTAPLYDEACAYIHDYLGSLDSLSGFGYAKYFVGNDLLTVSMDSRTFSALAAGNQRDYAKEWFAEHPAPGALRVSVSDF